MNVLKAEQEGVQTADMPLQESDELAPAQKPEENVEAQPEATGDGPGPNNTPVSHENLSEELVSDIDVAETTEAVDKAEDEIIV